MKDKRSFVCVVSSILIHEYLGEALAPPEQKRGWMHLRRMIHGILFHDVKNAWPMKKSVYVSGFTQ